MTVLLILCILLAAVAVAQGIRAEVYKRRAEWNELRAEDAEAAVQNVMRQVDELRVWVENNLGNRTEANNDVQ